MPKRPNISALLVFSAYSVVLLSGWKHVAVARPGFASEIKPSNTSPTSNYHTAQPFRLTDIHQRPIVFDADRSSGLTVICFLGTECPLARLYGPRLERLSKKYNQQTVRFIGINSNRQDSLDDLKAYAREQGITFPIGKDNNNVIADLYGVERTPEVILVDQVMQIRYRGRIDDQYAPGVARSSAERQDLRIAIEELLAGKPVSIEFTQPEGCLVGRVAEPDQQASVTFADDVAAVLNRHCVECHRVGEIGPFALTDYDEVAGWGDMMLEVIDNGRMPPWHADPDVGEFANQRLMPDADKQILREWVKQGMPPGDLSQIPPTPEFTDGWQLPRPPDVVIEMRKRPFEVPADGTVEYQYFVVDPKFETDVWVTAAEVIPGNPAVVHHSIVFIRPPDGTRMQGIGWLAAYVPGQRLPDFDPKLARKVRAGSRLVFQQHYTPNGTAQSDVTKVGLLLADDPASVQQELITLVAKNQGFELKPNEDGQVVKAHLKRIPAYARLLNVAPHMHFRGNQFSAVATLGSDSRKLLHVPNYDFNWQHSYQFAEPISLENVERIDAEFVFDNSKNNPFNPDPDSYVTWGDQTWEEMAIAFFDVARPIRPSDRNRDPSDDSNTLADVAPLAEVAVKIKRKTDELFERFDTNGDDVIVRGELPLAVRVKFGRYDTNKDRKVSREEIEAQFRSRFE